MVRAGSSVVVGQSSQPSPALQPRQIGLDVEHAASAAVVELLQGTSMFLAKKIA
ncbi:hypothetical protein SM11_pC1494 (plasmid) [Sinorhizobium meliloti SM11]|uniref:Uncharacterized protein n=1 Tax=Sinorhizobium meliloti (strain SM11) TaxID=707241 RepID=F7XBY0_SINMM|nr:hypothetical protein SM11_pC1494 [Sinorhizobium meliloti SM11]